MIKEIIKEIRLLLCQWVMGLILLIVPECEEGDAIVSGLKSICEELIRISFKQAFRKKHEKSMHDMSGSLER